ncbi:PQQ-binding-like beta-propeller repeat protein [Chamaesiphon minutus]|uniref:outer membrane protein assembly factor BamB family protein n=1 Tax=Chamaesiphon minutus TaxID=1173032 RepID=UPI0002F2A14B|nr:PQQ-binding-like beta-propeller repeat protein [Chamaesiphon minutus]
MSNQKLATQYRADEKRLSLGCIAWILAILSIPAALIGSWGWSYLNGKGTALIALDASSGKYLWSAAIGNDFSRLQSLMTAERSGIYLLCLKYGKVTEVDSIIFSLDRQTGKPIWYAQYPNRVGSSLEKRDLISNSKTVYGVLQNRSDNGSIGWEDAVVAIANTDGKQRWQWKTKFRLYEETLAVDEERFFILASVPRWRLLFGAID